MKKKILYSSGAFATTLSYQTFTAFILFFYVDTLKLDPKLVGLGWAIYGLWNAVNDPLAGYLADSTRTRWGRRLPYIAGGAVPLALAFALLWTPPLSIENGESWPLFAYFITVILVFDTLWTLVALNYTALFPEMFSHVQDRAHVSAWRQVFNVAGLLGALGLSPIIHSTLGWPALGWLFAPLIASVLFLSLTVSRERPECRQETPLGFSAGLKATLVNRSFLAFIGTNLFIQVAFVMIPAMMPFFAKYVLQISDSWQVSALMALPLLVILPTLPVWNRVTIRLGPASALGWALGAFALALVSLFWVRDFVSSLLVMGFLGVGLGGLFMLPDLLIADVIDEDELKTGVRREGLYFGMNGFLIRFAFTLQGLITGMVLSATGYQADAPEQAAEALWGLRFLIAGVPLGALGLSWLALRFYTLRGEHLNTMKEALARLHAQKAARLAR
jgi:GPH family glycoside/pentoside/hexuronide:cation symporter